MVVPRDGGTPVVQGNGRRQSQARWTLLVVYVLVDNRTEGTHAILFGRAFERVTRVTSNELEPSAYAQGSSYIHNTYC